jgi:hypothetical protein
MRDANMGRIIKTFLKRKSNEPSIEDMVAFNTARMALQVRVEQLMRQGPAASAT